MKIPRVITHKTMGPLLAAISREPEFQCGSREPYDPSKWYRREVILEFPTGEIAKDMLTTMALLGRRDYETAVIDGSEQWNAQGLEGKIRVRKELLAALMNLRDILPEHRGRIVTEGRIEMPEVCS